MQKSYRNSAAMIKVDFRLIFESSLGILHYKYTITKSNGSYMLIYTALIYFFVLLSCKPKKSILPNNSK